MLCGRVFTVLFILGTTSASPRNGALCSSQNINSCCDQAQRNCYIRAGGCFCDPRCRSRRDCCDDIDTTCLLCRTAGLAPGCCKGRHDECRIPNSNFFCDSLCVELGDCGGDVEGGSQLEVFNNCRQMEELANQANANTKAPQEMPPT